jgi:hypothetical protein
LTCQIKEREPAIAGERRNFPLSPVFTGFTVSFDDLILGLAPQALCLRLLSQAKMRRQAFMLTLAIAG